MGEYTQQTAVLPQIARNSQNLLLRRASHRLHRFTQIRWVRKIVAEVSCLRSSKVTPTDCTDAILGEGVKTQLTRAESPTSHSPGQRPGYNGIYMNNAPCKGNTLIIRLLPLQGVGLVWRIFTQGAALGYVLLPLRGVLFMSFDTPSHAPHCYK